MTNVNIRDIDIVTRNINIPIRKGFFLNRDKDILFKDIESRILFTSISSPVKNIRKINPVKARNSRILILSTEKLFNKGLAIINPSTNSSTGLGILVSLARDFNIGIDQASAAIINKGR